MKIGFLFTTLKPPYSQTKAFFPKNLFQRHYSTVSEVFVHFEIVPQLLVNLLFEELAFLMVSFIMAEYVLTTTLFVQPRKLLWVWVILLASCISTAFLGITVIMAYQWYHVFNLQLVS
jgi:hypothetical protein